MDVTRLLVALVLGLILLMFMIVRTKIHAFLALILSAAFVGIVGGIELSKIPGIITAGFGGTLGSIGIVIAFGVMMGQIMEESNAAKVMARTFINALKGKNEEIALAFTGFLVSIPIFADSAFIILAPLVKSISQAKKKSVVMLGIAMGMSLAITHATVPPTPGPLGVIGVFGINPGTFILFSFFMGLPIMVVAIACGRYFGKKYYKIVDENGDIIDVPPQDVNKYMLESAQKTVIELDPNEKYPSAFLSFAPIIVPVLLILLSTVTAMVYKGEPTMLTEIIGLVGSPVLAVAAGLIIAIYGLTASKSREEVIECMERGIRTCGIIILITGAGGAFGQVLKSSGVGDVIAQGLTAANFPAIVLPFLMAGILKFALGSGTVSMITTASICAPILAAVPGVNLMYAAYAACIGSQMFSLQNDSFFWVLTRTLGIKKVNEQVLGWCGTQFICSWVGFALLMIVSFIF